MAITDPQAVKFCNERVRIFADALETVYESAKRFQSEYVAIGASALLPNTAEEVSDGAAQDGRKKITGAMATALKTAADDIVTWMETGSPMRIARIRQISVNGLSRF